MATPPTLARGRVSEPSPGGLPTVAVPGGLRVPAARGASTHTQKEQRDGRELGQRKNERQERERKHSAAPHLSPVGFLRWQEAGPCPGKTRLAFVMDTRAADAHIRFCFFLKGERQKQMTVPQLESQQICPLGKPPLPSPNLGYPGRGPYLDNLDTSSELRMPPSAERSGDSAFSNCSGSMGAWKRQAFNVRPGQLVPNLKSPDSTQWRMENHELLFIMAARHITLLVPEASQATVETLVTL